MKQTGFEYSSTYSQAIDSSRRYYAHLLNDPELRSKINERKVIVIPILVDEVTGEAIKILNDSSFFVPQGEPLPEMPTIT